MPRFLKLSHIAVAALCTTGALIYSSRTGQSQESLGGLGAASAGSATLNAGANGNMGRSMQRARSVGTRSQDEMNAMEGGSGGSGGGGADGSGGSGGEGGGGGYPGGGEGGQGAPPPPRTPLQWTTQSGDQMINELLSHGSRRATVTTRTTSRRGRTRRVVRSTRRGRTRSARTTSPRRSPAQQARWSRDILRTTPKQRSAMIGSKYVKPPVGWLAYYAVEDRYKLTSGMWKYVTIEDDNAAYPMRYYYHPRAANFLRMIGRPPSGVRRYNRVIGFYTWQDAVNAGYRPDPISKPEPGAQLAAIAGLTRGPHLAKYTEFVYSGEVAPETFTANYTYIQRVARVVNSRSYTRPLMGETIERVLAAFLGEGTVPTTVGGNVPPPMPAPDAGGMGGGYPGGGGGYPGGGGGYPGGGGGYPGGSS